MSEEEKTIEDVKEIINRCKECKFATCEQCEINWTQIKTVEHLLDLYNKEKEKNKKIFNQYEKRVNELELEIATNSISKDKIKAKIKELEEEEDRVKTMPFEVVEETHRRVEQKTDILKELLEGEPTMSEEKCRKRQKYSI